MKTMQMRMAGAAGALLVTLGWVAALHGYAAGIQRSAPREVIEFESVTVTAPTLHQARADSLPHVGEL